MSTVSYTGADWVCSGSVVYSAIYCGLAQYSESTKSSYLADIDVFVAEALISETQAESKSSLILSSPV